MWVKIANFLRNFGKFFINLKKNEIVVVAILNDILKIIRKSFIVGVRVVFPLENFGGGGIYNFHSFSWKFVATVFFTIFF
jgi:hypothetical protein